MPGISKEILITIRIDAITGSNVTQLSWDDQQISMNTCRKDDITVAMVRRIVERGNGTLAMMNERSLRIVLNDTNVRFGQYAKNIGIQVFRAVSNF
jgi:hypothetical protein